MSPCGCTSGCGCSIVAGAGLLVTRIGDTFQIGLSGNVVYEEFAASATIAANTEIVLYDGAAAQTLDLPSAIAGKRLEVWNLDAADDVTVAAAAGETVAGLPDVNIPSLWIGRFISVVTGEWLAHVS